MSASSAASACLWIPAFAGMTVSRGIFVIRATPQHLWIAVYAEQRDWLVCLDICPLDEGCAYQNFRRSGEGRNPAFAGMTVVLWACLSTVRLHNASGLRIKRSSRIGRCALIYALWVRDACIRRPVIPAKAGIQLLRERQGSWWYVCQQCGFSMFVESGSDRNDRSLRIRDARIRRPVVPANAGIHKDDLLKKVPPNRITFLIRLRFPPWAVGMPGCTR